MCIAMPAETPSRRSPSVLGVIPARLASQRLPRKVLREIAGKPLLAWTYAAALACPQLDEVLIAVDSDEVAELCERNRWPWRMTSPTLPSGTDRLEIIAREKDADIYVNIQADEPLIRPVHIEALLAPFQQASVDVSTLKIRATPEQIDDPNAVKVVTALDGRALYFSRSPIPFHRDPGDAPSFFRHLGLYAYRQAALARFAALGPSPLEQAEMLEQLRLLEHGLGIYVQEVTVTTVGVDTEEDLRQVAAILGQQVRSH